jgi:hypothetical protein
MVQGRIALDLQYQLIVSMCDGESIAGFSSVERIVVDPHLRSATSAA